MPLSLVSVGLSLPALHVSARLPWTDKNRDFRLPKQNVLIKEGREKILGGRAPYSERMLQREEPGGKMGIFNCGSCFLGGESVQSEILYFCLADPWAVSVKLHPLKEGEGTKSQGFLPP